MESRILIVLYAVGLSLLALYPLQQRHGGWNALWTRYAPVWAQDTLESGLVAVRRHASGIEMPDLPISVASPDRSGKRMAVEIGDGARRSGDTPIVKVRPREEKLDRLTKQDRRELDDLFTDLEKPRSR